MAAAQNAQAGQAPDLAEIMKLKKTMDSMVKLMKGPKKTDKAQATLDMTQVKPVETKPIETAKPQETATITPVIKEKPAKKS